MSCYRYLPCATALLSAIFALGCGPPPLTISIDDPSVAEGNAATTNLAFTVALLWAPDAGADVTVDWAAADGTATTADSDYVAANGTLTFTSGGPLWQTVTVVVNGDATVEDNETLTVTLTNPVNATISVAFGTGTITNDDATIGVTISITDESELEGTNLVFTVAITAAPAASMDVKVDWATANVTATAGADYTAVTAQTLTFTNGGALTQLVTVFVTPDTTVEVDETLTVDLSANVNATFSDSQGQGTIQNDDFYQITVDDVSLDEGQSGNTSFDFAVKVSPAVLPSDLVTVYWETTDDTATVADSDYALVTATQLTFNPTETTKTASVLVTGDANVEPNELFYVDLSIPSANAEIVGFGIGTILNDDFTPGVEISIDEPTVAEGDAGTVDLVFTVTITDEPAVNMDVTVDWATANGTATAGTDYTAVTATTLTFTNGAPLTQLVTVTVTGDTLPELNEDLYVDLSNAGNAAISVAFGTGTITNDDATPGVTISIADESELEGTDLVFDVTISAEPAVNVDVTVDWETDDGTATAGADYTAVPATTLTFTNGASLTQQVTVTVTVDTLPELAEELFVDLWNPVNATLSVPSATGTIVNDDAPVRCVDPTGSNADGQTWATAYQTLAAATGALSGLGGGEAWVAAGTYTRGAEPVIFMLSDVDLYGGFEGYAGGAGAQETNRADRDWLLNATTLDGEGARRVVNCTLASDARLDGFTVANGGAAGGAGINISGQALIVVANCTFLDNISTTVAGAAGVTNSTGIEFVNCLFDTNTATGGGGAALRTATGSSVTLTDCTFVDNWTVTGDWDHGGAIQCIGGTLVVTDCDFNANRSAGCGGALYATSAATVHVSRCTFQGNAATGAVGHGGAILTVDGVFVAAVSCVFSGNTADAAMDGGGVHLLDTPGELTNCVFEANAAGGVGGGAYVETSTGDHYVVITNSTFEGNQAADGGALYNNELGGILTVDVSNSVMWWNSAATVANAGAPAVGFEYSDVDGSGGSGAWIAAFGTDYGLNIDDVPFFFNIPLMTDWTSADGTAATVEITDAATYYAADDIIEIADDGVARTVSLVAGTTVTFDPALGSASAAGTRVDNWGSGATDMVVDLRVDDGVPSPCIDTGNNASIAPDTTDLDGDSDTTEDVPYDLDGLDRIQNSDVDMGVYEQ